MDESIAISLTTTTIRVESLHAGASSSTSAHSPCRSAYPPRQRMRLRLRSYEVCMRNKLIEMHSKGLIMKAAGQDATYWILLATRGEEVVEQNGDVRATTTGVHVFGFLSCGFGEYSRTVHFLSAETPAGDGSHFVVMLPSMRCSRDQLSFIAAIMDVRMIAKSYLGIQAPVQTEMLKKNRTEDYLWMSGVEFDGTEAMRFMRRMLIHGMFVLPHEMKNVVLIPAPPVRFCFDLRNLQAPTVWFPPKLLKRRKWKDMSKYRVLVNRAPRETMCQVAEYHKPSTWLTPSLINCLAELCNTKGHPPGTDTPDSRCAGDNHEFAELTILCFELWDMTINECVAAVLSYRVGDVACDFSMATFTRDERSFGHLLTRACGELYEANGAKLFYWGMEVPYMTESYSDCCILRLTNKQFYDIWETLALMRHSCWQLKTDFKGRKGPLAIFEPKPNQ